MERTFDRQIHFDPASRAFPVGAVLDVQLPRAYTHSCYARLDQGPDGACVGFGWEHEAACKPTVVKGVTYQTAMHHYQRARALDGYDWPEGSTVLAGAKAAQELGHLKVYRWSMGLRDTALAVGRKGPGVAGSWFWSGMFKPDSDGFVHPTGERVGGHCYVLDQSKHVWQRGILAQQKTSDDWLRYIDPRASYFGMLNSWGPDWALGGRAKISWEEWEKLQLDDGELCIPTQR